MTDRDTPAHSATPESATEPLSAPTGSSIEACSRARVVLLDKTGTLTDSTPQLVTIDALDGRSEQEVLRLAAIAEMHSAHPLARAVLAPAGQRGLTIADPEQFEVASGHGIIAVHTGRRITVGNDRFLDRSGITVPGPVRALAADREQAGHTLAYVLHDDAIIDVLGFLAQPRASAAAVIRGLCKLGVRRIVMVTGDRSRPAQAVASQLGIDYRAQATPEARLAEVQRWTPLGNTSKRTRSSAKSETTGQKPRSW